MITHIALAPCYYGLGDSVETAVKTMRKAGFRGRTNYLVFQLSKPVQTISVCSMFGPQLPEGVEKTIVLDKRTKAQRPK